MGWKQGLFAGVASATACLTLAAGAAAAPFEVTRLDDPVPDACNPGDCSLREAIRAANAAPGPDSIALAAGTYVLSQAGTGESESLNGDLDVNDSLTLTGAGAGATTIDGGGLVTGERVLHLDSVDDATDPVVELADLALVRGAGGQGSGVLLDNRARATMRSVVLRDNGGDSFGGAIYNDNDANLTILDSLITENTLTGGFAGAIYNNNQATLTIERTRITDNRSGGFAGAIYANNDGHITIRDSQITGNGSASHGGALYLQNESVVTIENSTISGNFADAPAEAGFAYGGGIYIQNEAQVTVTNSTISGNRADDQGGGVAIRNVPFVRFINVTVADNTADLDGTGEAGGGIHFEPDLGGSLTLANTLVAGNHNPAAPDCGGPATITSAGHNLIGDLTGCTIPPAVGDLGSVDPVIGPLADNGGATQTHALLAGSPAIDAGDPAPFGSAPATCPLIDQRGAPRSACDIGAYELVTCKGAPVNGFVVTGKPLVGTDAAEVILGTDAPDRIDAAGGNDRICAGAGNDRASGGAGNDRVLGQAGKDKLKGGAGKDKLVGAAGKDKLSGGAGKDKLDCGPGRDKVKGGAGKDRARKCERGRA